jgi:hypothetical protein
LAGIRARLATGEPLELLGEASGLVSAVDPRSRNPMERDPASMAGPSLAALVETFANVDRRETTASVRRPSPPWTSGNRNISV